MLPQAPSTHVKIPLFQRRPTHRGILHVPRPNVVKPENESCCDSSRDSEWGVGLETQAAQPPQRKRHPRPISSRPKVTTLAAFANQPAKISQESRGCGAESCQSPHPRQRAARDSLVSPPLPHTTLEPETVHPWSVVEGRNSGDACGRVTTSAEGREGPPRWLPTSRLPEP